MKPGPSAAYKNLSDYLKEDSPPIDVEVLLSTIIIGMGWKQSQSDADENAEKWKRAFLQKLRRELSGRRENGQHSVYTFNSSNAEMVQGSCYVEPGDSADTIQLKQRLLLHKRYLSAVRALSADDFERLCAGILGILGVKKPRKSMATGDDGIDFFGRLQLDEHLPAQALSHSVLSKLNVWIVGQAKHYPDSVLSTAHFREIVGTVHLARHRVFGRDGVYEDLNIRANDPVFCLFVTTGDLSSRAWRVAQGSGVVGIDGQQVASLLATNCVGHDASGVFSKVDFDGWIQSQ